MSEMTEPGCTCGVGNMFWSHLHDHTCPCATSPLMQAPPSEADTLRQQLADAVATHATALATVQAERKIAEDRLHQVTKELSEKTTEFSDQLATVTKELEEAKAEIERLRGGK